MESGFVHKQVIFCLNLSLEALFSIASLFIKICIHWIQLLLHESCHETLKKYEGLNNLFCMIKINKKINYS